MPDQKKILLTGLAAAGKTSILRALDQDFLGLHQLSPTKGVEHSKMRIFGVDIFRWDLGGQDAYREKYLEDKERYFFDTSLIIYVLNIQEEETLPNVTYIEKVIHALVEVDTHPIFTVFFHKFDPHLLLTSDILRKRMEDYIQEIDARKGDLQVRYYPTSIYDLPSLIKSFSNVFLQMFPQQDLLTTQLGDTRAILGTPVLAVADTSPLLIAQSYSPDLKEDVVKDFENRLLAMSRAFKNKESTSIAWSIEPFSSALSIVIFAFTLKTDTYILAGLFKKSIFREDESIRNFDSKVKDVIRNIKKILEIFYT